MIKEGLSWNTRLTENEWMKPHYQNKEEKAILIPKDSRKTHVKIQHSQ